MQVSFIFICTRYIAMNFTFIFTLKNINKILMIGKTQLFFDIIEICMLFSHHRTIIAVVTFRGLLNMSLLRNYIVFLRLA